MTLELLFVLPILMALLLATVEFSMTALVRQQLLAASREGARAAAAGAGTVGAERAARLALGGGRVGTAAIEVVNADAPPGGAVEVWARLPTARAVPDLLGFIGYSIRGDVTVARTVMRKE